MAEFAPAARQAVEPPPTTAGDAAIGAPGRGRNRATTTTQPTATATSTPETGGAGAPTTVAARSRPCYGNPPRQLPDPRSPACLATIFEGDNGGATTKGVTATEIRVAVPYRNVAWNVGQPTINALFEYVNQSFELYGRRLVPVFVPWTSTNDAAAARAYGAEIAAQNVFAALTGLVEWNWGGNSPQEPMYLELARRQIISIANGMGQWLSDRTLFDPLHPYMWSVHPSAEDQQRNLVDFACTALAGRKASHAGDVRLRGDNRKFGVIAMGVWEIPATRILADGLAACAGQPTVVSLNGTGDWRATILRLQQAGVTTAVCVCEGYNGSTAYSVGVSAGFGPEWLLSSNVTPDEEEWRGAVQSAPFEPALFGPMERAKLVPWQVQPWYPIVARMSPQVFGDGTSINQAGYYGRALYDQLLVLASGIQGAGPQLTPHTFGSAQVSMAFPNTGAGMAPDWQPTVGFGPGDHSFYDDYALVWWNAQIAPRQLGYGPAVGSWCYLDRGARFSVGRYPADADARLFVADQPCD